METPFNCDCGKLLVPVLFKGNIIGYTHNEQDDSFHRLFMLHNHMNESDANELF